MDGIRKARRDARLTLRQVADLFGRTGEWLRRIEIGTLDATPELRAKIMDAIKKLRSLMMESRVSAKKLHSELRMERAANRLWQ